MRPAFDRRRYLIPFRTALLPQIFTDVLVIGGGVAGMRAALAARAHGEVILVNKSTSRQSNTEAAQGGIAAVLKEEDSFEAHAADTVAAGAGLCDGAVVEHVVARAPQRVQELIDWGMPFDLAGEGAGGAQEPALGREGGHRCRRILHANGDATGRALVGTLQAQVAADPEIRVFDHCFVIDLLTLDPPGRRCLGAVTHHEKYGLQIIWAHATILAAGGCGQVWRESTNPPVATGDGLAMGWRAGAEVADMAFMQFHPTTLYIAGSSRALVTEAVRGEGARLVDRHGHAFMPDYHPDGDLAPRDVVSRSIIEQMERTHAAWVNLDCSAIGPERFRARFPGISRLLASFELEPGVDPIPVHPSAHYMIGGLVSDLEGRTSLPGLYACGEAACTGLHGANRLASNSLLEGLVFGEAAGRSSLESIEAAHPGPRRLTSEISISERVALDLSDVRSSLRSVMWRHVGIEREGDRLREVAEMFDFWAQYTLDKIFDDREGWQVQNMLWVGALVTRSAAWRGESRGTHYRKDAPEPREALRVHDLWRSGRQAPETRPRPAEGLETVP